MAKQHARNTYWRAEAKEAAAATSEGRVTSLGQGPDRAGPEDPYALVRSLRKRLRGFWEHQSTQFSQWWRELPAKEKEGFLLAGGPNMPRARGDTHAMVGGQREYVGGMSTLAPELNLKELMQGDTLLQLFNQRVEQARAEAAAEAQAAAEGTHALLFVDDLDWQDKEMVQRLVEGRQLVRATPPRAITSIAGGPNSGQVLEWARHAPQAERQRLLESSHGLVMDADVYFFTRQRQVVVLSALIVYADNWRMDVLGKEKPMGVAASGCANCGVTESPGGGKLLFCSGCRCVAYCGQPCQRQHWKTHKLSCSASKQRKEAAGQQKGQQQAAEQEEGNSGASS